MGVAAILVMWPGPFEQTYVPSVIRSVNVKFEFNWPSGFKKKRRGYNKDTYAWEKWHIQVRSFSES